MSKPEQKKPLALQRLHPAGDARDTVNNTNNTMMQANAFSFLGGDQKVKSNPLFTVEPTKNDVVVGFHPDILDTICNQTTNFFFLHVVLVSLPGFRDALQGCQISEITSLVRTVVHIIKSQGGRFLQPTQPLTLGLVVPVLWEEAPEPEAQNFTWREIQRAWNLSHALSLSNGVSDLGISPVGPTAWGGSLSSNPFGLGPAATLLTQATNLATSQMVGLQPSGVQEAYFSSLFTNPNENTEQLANVLLAAIGSSAPTPSTVQPTPDHPSHLFPNAPIPSSSVSALDATSNKNTPKPSRTLSKPPGKKGTTTVATTRLETTTTTTTQSITTEMVTTEEKSRNDEVGEAKVDAARTTHRVGFAADTESSKRQKVGERAAADAGGDNNALLLLSLVASQVDETAQGGKRNTRSSAT